MPLLGSRDNSSDALVGLQDRRGRLCFLRAVRLKATLTSGGVRLMKTVRLKAATCGADPLEKCVEIVPSDRDRGV
jgi:hypothetical protein